MFDIFGSYQNLTPYEFVEGMKKKGIRVPGIGHRLALFPYTSIFKVLPICEWVGVQCT